MKIFKRKQKKIIKRKKTGSRPRNRPRKRPRKKKEKHFFLIVFLVGFLVESLFSFFFSYFLVFFYKFSPQRWKPDSREKGKNGRMEERRNGRIFGLHAHVKDMNAASWIGFSNFWIVSILPFFRFFSRVRFPPQRFLWIWMAGLNTASLSVLITLRLLTSWKDL